MFGSGRARHSPVELSLEGGRLGQRRLQPAHGQNGQIETDRQYKQSKYCENESH